MRGCFLKAKLNTGICLVEALLYWLHRRHKVTERRSLVRFLLFNYRRLVCFLNFLVNQDLFFNFRLNNFGLLHFLIFFNNLLSSFLSRLDRKGCEALIMLTARLWLFITLCPTVPFRVIENYFSLLIKAFDFTKLNLPLLGWHYREITLSTV